LKARKEYLHASEKCSKRGAINVIRHLTDGEVERRRFMGVEQVNRDPFGYDRS
jgi:hypothetical protein